MHHCTLQHTLLTPVDHLCSQYFAVGVANLFNQNFTIISGYLQYSMGLQEIESLLLNIIENSPCSNLIISIDANAHSPLWYEHYLDARGNLIENIILSTGLHILNTDRPTWRSRGCSSIIDLTIVSQSISSRQPIWTTQEIPVLSDHIPISLTIPLVLLPPLSLFPNQISIIILQLMLTGMFLKT